MQPFLVLQVSVAAPDVFSVELNLTDRSGTKRRLLLSTAYSKVTRTSLHTQLPLATLIRDTWVNLCLDLPSIVAGCFPGHEHRHVDGVTLSAQCRVRRVFTLRAPPMDTVSYMRAVPGAMPIPAAADFPATCVSQTQVLGMPDLETAPSPSGTRHTASAGFGGGRPGSQDDGDRSLTRANDLGTPGLDRKARSFGARKGSLAPGDGTVLAFGSRVPVALSPQVKSRGGGGASGDPAHPPGLMAGAELLNPFPLFPDAAAGASNPASVTSSPAKAPKSLRPMGAAGALPSPGPPAAPPARPPAGGPRAPGAAGPSPTPLSSSYPEAGAAAAPKPPKLHQRRPHRLLPIDIRAIRESEGEGDLLGVARSPPGSGADEDPLGSSGPTLRQAVQQLRRRAGDMTPPSGAVSAGAYAPSELDLSYGMPSPPPRAPAAPSRGDAAPEPERAGRRPPGRRGSDAAPEAPPPAARRQSLRGGGGDGGDPKPVSMYEFRTDPRVREGHGVLQSVDVGASADARVADSRELGLRLLGRDAPDLATAPDLAPPGAGAGAGAGSLSPRYVRASQGQWAGQWDGASAPAGYDDDLSSDEGPGASDVARGARGSLEVPGAAPGPGAAMQLQGFKAPMSPQKGARRRTSSTDRRGRGSVEHPRGAGAEDAAGVALSLADSASQSGRRAARSRATPVESRRRLLEAAIAHSRSRVTVAGGPASDLLSLAASPAGSGPAPGWGPGSLPSPRERVQDRSFLSEHHGPAPSDLEGGPAAGHADAPSLSLSVTGQGVPPGGLARGAASDFEVTFGAGFGRRARGAALGDTLGGTLGSGAGRDAPGGGPGSPGAAGPGASLALSHGDALGPEPSHATNLVESPVARAGDGSAVEHWARQSPGGPPPAGAGAVPVPPPPALEGEDRAPGRESGGGGRPRIESSSVLAGSPVKPPPPGHPHRGTPTEGGPGAAPRGPAPLASPALDVSASASGSVLARSTAWATDDPAPEGGPVPPGAGAPGRAAAHPASLREAPRGPDLWVEGLLEDEMDCVVAAINPPGGGGGSGRASPGGAGQGAPRGGGGGAGPGAPPRAPPARVDSSGSGAGWGPVAIGAPLRGGDSPEPSPAFARRADARDHVVSYITGFDARKRSRGSAPAGAPGAPAGAGSRVGSSPGGSPPPALLLARGGSADKENGGAAGGRGGAAPHFATPPRHDGAPPLAGSRGVSGGSHDDARGAGHAGRRLGTGKSDQGARVPGDAAASACGPRGPGTPGRHWALRDSRGSRGGADRSREASRMSDWDPDLLGAQGSRMFTPPVLPGWRGEAKPRDAPSGDGAAGPQVFHADAGAGGAGGAGDVMELIYDPVLNCYYDAATSQYYEIK